jgi:hypothetical protein
VNDHAEHRARLVAHLTQTGISTSRANALLDALLTSAPQGASSSDPNGDDWFYRVTTVPNDRYPKPDSQYFRTAYQARGSRDSVRAIDVEATVGRVPGEAFALLSDAELDRLAQQELDQIHGTED